MKKRLVLLICFSLCGAVLFGCGKSEKDKVADYYQEELGLNEEDADKLADAFYGEDTSSRNQIEEEESVAKEEPVLNTHMNIMKVNFWTTRMRKTLLFIGTVLNGI